MKTGLYGAILIAVTAALALAVLIAGPGNLVGVQANHGTTVGNVNILAIDTDITNPDTVNGGAAGGNSYHERLLLGECGTGTGDTVDQDGDTVPDDGCFGIPPLNEVGDIDTCNDSMSVAGDTLEIDIVVDEVDASDLMFGWSFNLNYDQSVVEIIGVDGAPGPFTVMAGENRRMMIASLWDSGNTGGFIELGADNPSPFIPDADGQLVELISDFGVLTAAQTHEAGEGVLLRVELRAVGTGISPLDIVGTVGNPITIVAPPAPGTNLTINSIQGAEVRVGQSCPILLLDSDGDGFADTNEDFVGTDPNLACSTTGAVTHPGDTTKINDEAVDNWPADMNDDQVVNLSDMLYLAPPMFFSVGPNPPYRVRYDLNLDGVINLADMLYLAPPVFFATCTPAPPPIPTCDTKLRVAAAAGRDNIKVSDAAGCDPGDFIVINQGGGTEECHQILDPSGSTLYLYGTLANAHSKNESVVQVNVCVP